MSSGERISMLQQWPLTWLIKSDNTEIFLAGNAPSSGQYNQYTNALILKDNIHVPEGQIQVSD